jgi:nucleoside-diphosphate-sugar epimerase
VIGPKDPTKRFEFHVNSLIRGAKIFHPNWDALVSFISDLDAASCLQYLAESRLKGAFNFKSGDISFKEMMESISRKIGKEVRRGTENDGERSPYSFSEDWTLDIERIEKAGLSPSTNLKTFLAELAVIPDVPPDLVPVGSRD